MHRVRWRWLAGLVSVLITPALGAQPASPCVRIAFGSWTPPLDWNGSGHADSSARIAGRIRELRDSVYANAPRTGRDEMVWSEVDGRQRLILFPTFWPAGVIITFAQGALGDTLLGDAEAMVADLARSPSRARARVLRNACARA
jgi:hypothetical protein